MKQERVRILIQHKLQELLLEYIRCLEQYCHIVHPEHPSATSLEQLDRFIVILRTLRKLLQRLLEETYS